MTDTRVSGDAGLALIARPAAGRAAGWELLRPVLSYHLITRLVTVVGLAVAAAIDDRSFTEVVMRWDGDWYLRVVRDGYPSELPVTPGGRVESSTAAFFPLFPLLAKGLMAFGLPFWLAGMIINLLASTGAAMIIVLVGTHYLDRHAARLLGLLWSAVPMASVLTVPYTEALFTLFAAAAVLFTLRRRWLLAGLAAALSGTVRAPGIVIAGAVGLAALVALLRDREPRSLIGAAIAPLGFVGSVVGIGLYAGRLDAWQATEHGGWQTELNFGARWLRWLDPSASTPIGYLHLLTAIVMAVLVLLALITVALRPPVPIIGLVLAGTFLAIGFDGVGMNAAPRIMLTMFPIFAPVAILLARCPRPVSSGLLGCAAVVGPLLGAFSFALAPLPP